MTPNQKHATTAGPKSAAAPAPASATPSAVRPAGVNCRLENRGGGQWALIVWTTDGSDLTLTSTDHLGDAYVLGLTVTPRKA